MNGRPAVFLDRDGTLTEPRHYPSRPEDLVLQPDVEPALYELQTQRRALVVITNQSGLARGLFSALDLDAMHRHLRRLLQKSGVVLDGIYACPHHSDGAVDGLSFRCGCRKPRPGLLHHAAEELGLDLSASWMVGDFDSDVEAGRQAGCRTALVGPAVREAASAGPNPAREESADGQDADRQEGNSPHRDALFSGHASHPTLQAATTAEALRRIARHPARALC
ncbi:D-glycero-alpha-D-manno-heptose-1,7-bisphosphate 7-phosphatase [Streptomyces sp. YGL11-2]|uniref:D-glycero-alpha-D-manno-heptose-1,7-bisphosphate 7-phosphatase n=1 Tax=Streptomyces sp. YGL11-2 TaxID=3414028 RepID=UPI003CF6B196